MSMASSRGYEIGHHQFTQRPRTGLVMCRGSGVHEHFINISRLEQVKHLGGEMFFCEEPNFDGRK